MKYFPSQRLADLLLIHGFTEITMRMFPDHFHALLEDVYDPQTTKRIFQKGELIVFFDFSNLILSSEHKGELWEGDITDTQLKSFLFFATRDHIMQDILKKMEVDILHLEEYYRKPVDKKTMNKHDHSFHITMKEIFNKFKI